MKDYIELLIAFVLGFFMKHLLGTVCQSRLIEGEEYTDSFGMKIYGFGDYCDKARVAHGEARCSNSYSRDGDMTMKGVCQDDSICGAIRVR